MILVLAGLHGAGKSHLSSYIAAEFGWTVCVKRDLLMLLHSHVGVGDDWVSWYRTLYTSEGPYEVMKRLLNFIPTNDRLIIDSVHNLAEWKAIKKRYPDAVLAAVIAPKAVRMIRNNPEDEFLDIQRVCFWHGDDGSCLIAESEWCFNGAASTEVQRIEFEAFFNQYTVPTKKEL
ncbi:MAG: hypothetical protein A3A24_00215 [Candidatus Buchananbacteria bacterium RIFCSPLOWO2_01_FULL_46_12]|nr:MAG: hypothetical protein A3A24_00215 [Candidatus Buchananbacteria bacterium RIFCSPLOWO2_01_FULL_46_12]